MFIIEVITIAKIWENQPTIGNCLNNVRHDTIVMHPWKVLP